MSLDDQDIESELPMSDELVPVVFGHDEEEAKEYCQLLADHDIDAVVGFDGVEERVDEEAVSQSMTRGVPVLVPENLLDEASEIIADREDSEDFIEEEDEDSDEEEEEFGMEPTEFEEEEDDYEEIDPDDDDLYEEGYDEEEEY